MIYCELEDWCQFQAKLKELDELVLSLRQKKLMGHISEIIFRGQASADWSLSTTLERATRLNEFNVKDYHNLIQGHMCEIQSFTDKEWSLPEEPCYRPRPFTFNAGVYEYMAHLRHHGFPSPLLDWTTSPYIASYFAFADRGSVGDKVAIFAYLEYAGSAKRGSSDEPAIWTQGPNVATHKRHFLQRCEYTVCTRRRDGGEFYSSHESAYARDQKDQDLLWKLTLPRAERKRVLKYLEQHNISAFSLFASEDKLMETLAMRIFDLGN